MSSISMTLTERSRNADVFCRTDCPSDLTQVSSFPSVSHRGSAEIPAHTSAGSTQSVTARVFQATTMVLTPQEREEVGAVNKEWQGQAVHLKREA
mmetsp:Transcript_71909/g.224204  ORF Transcript_71909/g.224204 Transcript_71909/m.224204 type:complete len:95 (-) Transcript_71909:8-292(-)